MGDDLLFWSAVTDDIKTIFPWVAGTVSLLTVGFILFVLWHTRRVSNQWLTIVVSGLVGVTCVAAAAVASGLKLETILSTLGWWLPLAVVFMVLGYRRDRRLRLRGFRHWMKRTATRRERAHQTGNGHFGTNGHGDGALMAPMVPSLPRIKF